jgi:hypothetical protein
VLATSYRTAAVLGGLLLVLGSFALVLLDPARGMTWATTAAFVVGAGMGMSNSTFMVAVQSAAAPNVRGIATASTVFARMLGSSLGTALLGAVMNLSLARGVSGFADPVQTLMDVPARLALPAAQRALLSDAVGTALHMVFVGGLVLAAMALAVAWLMPAGVRPGHASEAPRL